MILTFNQIIGFMFIVTLLAWINIIMFIGVIKAFGLNPNGFKKINKKDIYSNQEENSTVYTDTDYENESAENAEYLNDSIYQQILKELKPVSPDMPSVNYNGLFDYDEHEYNGIIYDDDVEVITDEHERVTEMSLR